MSLDPATERAIVAVIPSLRAFAISLCRNRDRADELVQETLARGIAYIGTFRQGSNLDAWLFTILRNTFNSDYRRRRREDQHADERHAEALAVPPDQLGWDIARDLRTGLARLSAGQRQALILVGASGLSYDAAARIAGCEVGTMKSRVNRARRLLAGFMSGERDGTRYAASHRSVVDQAA